MSARCVEIRRNPKHGKHCEYANCMEIPYDYIDCHIEEYCIDNITRFANSEANPDNFPNNIQEYFWIHEEENDYDTWVACGVLTNGSYFLYTAFCDSRNGFTNTSESGMTLWVSSSWDNIVNSAMDEETYQKYLIGTK
jgi:hypothetical protein